MGNLIGLSALTNDSVGGRRLLRMALTTSGTIGTKSIRIGSRNVAVAEDGDYAYLCVYVDAAATSSDDTTTISGFRYALSESGDGFCLLCSAQADSTPDNSIVIGNVALAVNADSDLIFKNATASIGTPDESDYVFWGDVALRVVRKGDNWYMAVDS